MSEIFLIISFSYMMIRFVIHCYIMLIGGYISFTAVSCAFYLIRTSSCVVGYFSPRMAFLYPKISSAVFGFLWTLEPLTPLRELLAVADIDGMEG